MKRSVATAMTAALALALLPVGSASAQSLDLAPAGEPRFPARAFALTLPSTRPLTAGQLTIRENGRSVPGVSVVPGTAAGERQLGLMLAIDASTSMRGEAIQGAMEAARTLAARRNARQRLGVLAFHGGQSTILRPTSDGAKIDAALAEPPELSRGTRIQDAVGAAIDALRRAGISGGSVVVLSDGSDVRSRLGREDVAAAAREVGVRVYAVGLRSSDFDARALRQVAAAGGGSYSEASSSAQLQRIYDELGTQLANQYLIRYRSPAGPRERVHVSVSVEGVPGTATADYTTPQLRVPGAAPFRRSLGESFWRSEAALVVVSLIAACLVGLVVMSLVRRPNRRRTLRKRLEAFVSSPEERSAAPLTAMADRFLVETEKSLERARWWPALKQEIEVARIPLAPVQVVALTGLATVLAVWLLSAMSGSPLGMAAGLATPFAVRYYIRFNLKRQHNLFADQLADHLQVVASAMRAGHSFVGALSVGNEDAPEPTRTEFERAVADERLGVPVEDALDRITERMDSPDMTHVALVAKLQRETGANAAEVLDRVAGTIRVRQELRRHIRALTAQQRIARTVLSGLPVALIVALTFLSPGYIDPLFEEPSGRIMLAGAALGIVMGSYIMKRLVEIEV